MNSSGSVSATWSPSGFFHLRSPLLPFDAFLAFSGEAKAARMADGPARVAALTDERRRARERLAAWVADPVVRAALRIASRDLDQRVEAWLAQPPANDDLDLDVALFKYFARMTGRATPFGLFAGTGLGQIGERLQISVPPVEDCSRRSMLDPVFMERVAQTLVRAHGAEARVRVAPTLHALAGRVRFTSVDPEPGGGFREESLIPDVALETALQRATGGATLREIASAVAARVTAASPDEAMEYAQALLDRGVFVADLEPVLTGDDRFDGWPDALRDIAAALRDLDESPLGGGERHLAAIATLAAGAGVAPTVRAVQVDLAKPMLDAEFPRAVAEELEVATRLLQRLFPTRRQRALESFRDRFVPRYGAREVPLLEACDEDIGIGYDPADGPNSDPSPLFEGLTFPSPPHATAPLDAAREWLLSRVEAVLASGDRELRIEESEVTRWVRDLGLPAPPPLPDAYSVLAAISASDDAAVRAGRYRLLHAGAGSQSAALLGRFCLRDSVLTSHVERLLRAEEALRPDAIFAEIVFRPAAPLANLARRPVLRSHEIIVHGRSGAPEAARIPLADLWVSVADDRIRLRSAALDREVLPRMASAFDGGHASNPGIVRFLWALQTQEGLGVRFSWGALEAMPVLPRVVCGRVVLARARWRLLAEDLASVWQSTDAARLDAATRLRERLRIPRIVGLVTDDDSALPLDLEHGLSLEVLARHAHTGCVLTELFPSPDESSLRGVGGAYVHELVIPFVRDRSVDMSRRAAPSRIAPCEDGATEVVRGAWPTSDWLYVKLYGGRAAADRLLTEHVAPWLHRLTAAGVAERWFFLRYEDPEPHLRLRVQGVAERLAADVLPSLREAAACWRAKKLVHAVELAAYEREVERFGGALGMEIAEEMFAADSDGVLRMLGECEDQVDRWQQTLLGAHHLLIDLGLDLEARIALLRDVEDRFGQEFGADAGFRSQVGALARRERRILAERLHSAPPVWVRERSARVRAIAPRLRDAIARGAVVHPLADLARVHLHLHVNRATRSSPRAHEFVLVALLRRQCESVRARGQAHPEGLG